VKYANPKPSSAASNMKRCSVEHLLALNDRHAHVKASRNHDHFPLLRPVAWSHAGTRSLYMLIEGLDVLLCY
jgi:hypothetical protein